jgi:microcystin-dependent protein
MSNIPIQFSIGAFPIGFKGNCQDFATALIERLQGEVQLGTQGFFQAQYGGPQPTTDSGPWWKNGTDLMIFDYGTGIYQPMEDQMPVGGCMLWAGAGAPANYLLCQGQQVSRTQYSRLFQRIGATWGAGDGSNTFNLPPGGRYIRTAGYDPNYQKTYYNGTVGGGVTSFTIQASNLPALIYLIYGRPTNYISGGGAYVVGTPTDTPVSYGTVSGTGQNYPINPSEASYQVMNLCIRYI